MVFTGESAWRWKMMMPAESRLYGTFWGQAARWLTADAPVSSGGRGHVPRPG